VFRNVAMRLDMEAARWRPSNRPDFYLQGRCKGSGLARHVQKIPRGHGALRFYELGSNAKW